MTGWGNIDIKVQGTFEDGQIYGLFNAENATVEMQGIDAKLTNGSAKLVFDNKNIIKNNFFI